MVVLEVHYFLQVITVAKLHEDVVPGVSLNGLSHFYNVLGVDRVLVLNLAHDQVLLGPAEGRAFYHFASVQLRVRIQVQLREGSRLRLGYDIALRAFGGRSIRNLHVLLLRYLLRQINGLCPTVYPCR